MVVIARRKHADSSTHPQHRSVRVWVRQQLYPIAAAGGGRSPSTVWAAESTAHEDYGIDLSQSISRFPRNVIHGGKMSCFTGSSMFWLIFARRPFSGREELAMQGISRRVMTQGLSDRLLGELAGNAFSTPCCMVATAALLGAVGRRFDGNSASGSGSA